MTERWRYRLAASCAALLALYVTTFAARTHTWIDLPTWLDLTEWPATLGYLAAAWFAWVHRARGAAVLSVGALFAFYLAQAHHMFAVPLGFIAATTLTFVILLLMPAATNR